MKEKLKNSKGITLIALVLTIVVILIIAVVAINITVGSGGLIERTNQAVALQKRGQYYEEINLAILEEQMDRAVEASNELFIVSLQKRLSGTQSPSAISSRVYPKRDWVESTEINANKILIVYTVEGYQILIDVDNKNNTATIREESYAPIENIEYTVSFNGNGETSGSTADVTVKKGLYVVYQNVALQKQTIHL